MKFLNIYLSYIIGLCSLAAADDIVNLNRIGEIFGFPSSQLIIEDYLEKERSAYRDKTLIESQNNISPPFEPDRIFKAYKISAKTKETFLPINFTVVARDAYRTEEIENLEIQMKSLREVPAAEGGACLSVISRFPNRQMDFF